MQQEPLATTPHGRGETLATFMAAPSGRIARVGLGIGLAITGVIVGPPIGYGLAAFAVLPIATGVFNLCPIAPLWGGRFSGAACSATVRTTHTGQER